MLQRPIAWSNLWHATCLAFPVGADADAGRYVLHGPDPPRGIELASLMQWARRHVGGIGEALAAAGGTASFANGTLHQRHGVRHAHARAEKDLPSSQPTTAAAAAAAVGGMSCGRDAYAACTRASSPYTRARRPHAHILLLNVRVPHCPHLASIDDAWYWAEATLTMLDSEEGGLSRPNRKKMVLVGKLPADINFEKWRVHAACVPLA